MLPVYFEHVNRALSFAGLTATFIFAVPTWDTDTREVIQGCKPTAEIIDTKEPQRSDHRVWNLERYRHMAHLRNLLLQEVRQMSADFYWSLDTDILPAEDALVRMLDNGSQFDAVGGRAFMAPPPDRCPSYSFLNGDQLMGRIDQEAVFQVDVIMATKLMGPRAYEVDYVEHLMGEDIGWSKACKEQGLRLGWNGFANHKHVMSPLLLDKTDPRLGW